MKSTGKVLLFVINVDWYFRLHWLDRAKYLQGLGFKVHILTNFTDNDFKTKLINNNFSCYQLPLKRKSLNIFSELKSILSIYDVIKRVNPDIVHSVTIKPNLYVGLIHRFTSKFPAIYSITGLGATFSSKSLLFRSMRKLAVLLYKFISTYNSHFIFEDSDDYNIFLSEKIIRNNGSVIAGAGVDTSKFYPSDPKGGSVVLFAARLLKDKGLSDLIEAKKILAANGVHFVIRVAGIIDNDAHSSIPELQIRQWYLSNQIEWLGQVDDMPYLIRTCDIVCLPTTYGEGVPRILIEAAACQRPIVASNVSGCREIVDNGVNGILCPPSDPQALAKSINKLLSDDSLSKTFGINGRLKVINKFAQEYVFKKTKNIYEKLLST